jgi:hypothetical protein
MRENTETVSLNTNAIASARSRRRTPFESNNTVGAQKNTETLTSVFLLPRTPLLPDRGTVRVCENLGSRELS